MSSDSWYEDTSWQNAGTREFLASVELWCPAKTTNMVRNLKVCGLHKIHRSCSSSDIAAASASPQSLGQEGFYWRRKSVWRGKEAQRCVLEMTVSVHQEARLTRRVTEKPSWFRSHVSSTTANGSWRSARCKLTEETDRSTLNIYVDVSSNPCLIACRP